MDFLYDKEFMVLSFMFHMDEKTAGTLLDVLTIKPVGFLRFNLSQIPMKGESRI